MHWKLSNSYLLGLLLTFLTGCAVGEPDFVSALPACDEDSSSISVPDLAENRWEITLKTKADIPAALAAMTLEEKIGQLVQTDIAAATPRDAGAVTISAGT